MKFRTTFVFGFILSAGLLFSMSGWSQSADSVAFNIQADEEEFEILKSLYEKAGGSRWKNNTNWLKGKTHADFATWFGVTVEHGDVVAIDLRDNGLKGELPDLVYKLVRLRQVSIENNTALRGERGKALGIAKQSGNELADELNYAKPQYGFIENKGQIHDQQNNPQPDVKFLLPLPNNNVVLRGAGFSYDTHIIEEKERTHGPTAMAGYKFDHEQVKDITYKFHRVDVELVDANPNPEIITSEQSSDYLMYHTGIQGSSQRVYHYGKVLYKNIYPNIDLEFVARPGETKPIEYSFYVHPGGDFKQIKLQYKGASLGALVNGKVELTLAHGKLTENIPASFMQRSRANVDIRYRKISSTDEKELLIGFEGDYQSLSETLIIDPTPNLDWGTYIQGNSTDEAFGITIDQSGFVYVVGSTRSITGIFSGLPNQSSYIGNGDAFVVKYNPWGQKMWGLYVGGEGGDVAYDITRDVLNNNYLYITGATESNSGIAVNSTYLGAAQGNRDAFLLKISSSGEVAWGNYIGGSNIDSGHGVISTTSGVVVVGATFSTNNGGFTGSLNGVSDGFMAKFSSGGNLIWGKYYGGSSADALQSVGADASDNIYVVGSTSSVSTQQEIATTSSHQSNKSGDSDAFLVKFDWSGQRLWGTYYGGNGADYGTDIFCLDGFVYLVGSTTSSSPTGSIAHASALQMTFGGSKDGFIAKFSTQGIRQWGSYYGGSQDDVIHGIHGSYFGIYVVGQTSSTGLASSNAHQNLLKGSSDGFITRFSGFDGQLFWSSYYGGDGVESATGVVVTSEFGTPGKAFMTGITNSVSSISTDLTTFGGSIYDGFIARFSEGDPNNFICNLQSGLNLPQWALGVQGPKTQLVDWRTTTPTISNAQNSPASVHAAGNVAIDGCGQLMFYVQHAGPDLANRLHIYTANGTRLTNESAGSPLLALNSVYPNVELQVVRVPDKSDEWFIIYSLFKTGCGGVSAYCPASVVYARVRFQATTQSLTILSREVHVNSSFTFTQGKAVSQHVNGDPTKHYLYLVQRSSGVQTTRFHRYIIDNSGIHSGEQSSNNIPAQYWNLTISGSSIELSSDGNWVAFLNRHESNFEDIILFDTRKFNDISYVPTTIKMPDLQLVPDGVTLQSKTPINQLIIANPTFSCLQHLQKKLIGIQFSPSGQYLYVTGGGYPYPTSGVTHRSYLLQIDLATGSGLADYDVRMQVQAAVGEISNCYGQSLAIAGANYNMMRYIESAHDGRIYFTKDNQSKLFVIPTPDCPMPQRLLPGTVDLSTPQVPNITINSGAFVFYMPETIDGYNYRQSGNGQIADLAITTDQYLCAIKFATNRIPDCQTTYLWNFGDGNTSLARAPIHVYSASGTFNVTVSITSNCASCSGSVELTRQVSFTLPTTVVKDTTIQVLSEQKLKVVNHSVSTFSDAWPLPHENVSLSEQNGFVNGSDGVWRNNGVYVYQAPRTATETVNIRTDGTYTLQTFNWKHAELQAIPNWTKANAITRYSPYSYELENRDVLGVYSAAVYDHYGQLPVATGVNMRNEEMAFTSFESVSGQPEGPSTGNWTIGSQNLPEYNYFIINAANGHMATVETPIAKLQGLTAADVGVYAMGPGEITNYQQNVGIVCMQQHPNTPNWTIVVLAVEPAAGVWTGTLRIKNIINQSGSPVLDNTRAHSGKRSLRINAPTTHKQELLKLQSGKRYHVSAWVSVGNPNVATPTLANNLGFDIILKQKTGQVISTTSFAPAGQVIEGWQQIRGVLDVPGDQPVIELVFKPGSLGTAWYDDLRLHPENGNMKSYVYNLLDYRLSAILDEENFASYFFYDAEGNLYLTKKETRDGVKTLTENMTYQVER